MLVRSSNETTSMNTPYVHVHIRTAPPLYLATGEPSGKFLHHLWDGIGNAGAMKRCCRATPPPTCRRQAQRGTSRKKTSWQPTNTVLSIRLQVEATL